MTKDVFPILYARDLPRLVRFYQLVGMTESFRFPNEGDPAYVTLSWGKGSLGIGLTTSHLASKRGERLAYVEDPEGNTVMLTAAVELDGEQRPKNTKRMERDSIRRAQFHQTADGIIRRTQKREILDN